MNVRQMLVAAIISIVFTVAMLTGSLLWFDGARAAPPVVPSGQSPAQSLQYVALSAMAFEPVQQNVWFVKDVDRQLLKLTGTSRIFTTDRNVFVAPLFLPDQTDLLALTLYGEDYDSQGEVRARIKRCDHNQARCLTLAETSSRLAFAGGRFEIRAVGQPELVNNGFYSYFVELNLTALNNSGLRAVRVEAAARDQTPLPPNPVNRWELTGSASSFRVPNSTVAQVKICTDDLSHLPNATHYPFVVADGSAYSLTSNACMTVWGQNVEIRRKLNAGSSTGTYQILN